MAKVTENELRSAKPRLLLLLTTAATNSAQQMPMIWAIPTIASHSERALQAPAPTPGVTIVIRAPVEQTIRDVTPAVDAGE